MGFITSFPNGALLSAVRAKINAVIAYIDGTGWANYADNQYTSVSPFSVAADTDTTLPNNAAVTDAAQSPSGVTLYDSVTQKITGRDGDGLLITIDCKVMPTSVSTTLIEFWIDIGGSVGQLYRRPVTFPKGNGEERPVSFSISAYTRDTWQSNGGVVKVRSNGPADIYDIRYVLTTTHRAR